MAPYRYSPLAEDEIRLLRLSPRCSGTVRIGIEVKKLSSSNRPQYEALSYVWGSQESPSEITIQDIDKSKDSEYATKTTPGLSASNSSHPIRTSPASRSGAVIQQAAHSSRSKVFLPVTANLAQALPYLQLEKEERVLWIDAICIDQENLSERGQQVARMADIFKMADRVVIWLGPADRHTQLAIETVECHAAEVDVNFVTEEVSERSEGSMSRLLSDGKIAKPLKSLFQRPWFERLWIWQQAHAKPDNAVVLVGDYSIMWNTIQKFLASYNSRPRDGTTKFHSLLGQAYKISRSIFAFNLISLLRWTTHCKHADDRDRIFALLGMLEPLYRFNIEPDYAKSAAEVFKQVVLRQFVTQRRLDVLHCCDLMHKSDGMPSWVPSWSKNMDYMGSDGCASPKIAAEAEYDGKSTLRVSGVDFDVVNSTQAPGLFERAKYYTSEEAWSSFVSIFFSLLPAHESEGELDRPVGVTMRTLCWNYWMDPREISQLDASGFSKVKESLLRWRAHLAKERGYPGVYEPPPPISSGDWYFRARVLDLATANHSLFRTTHGHLGLGPRWAAQGDKVCVLLGCGTPLLLRLVSDNQWCIVGDCYVDDIMDGSAFLSPLPENFEAIEQVDPRTGFSSMAFRNMRTNDIQIEDPRVTEQLPAGWEVAKHEGDSYVRKFRNKEQNLYTWHDPRLTPSALRARGVKLRTFNLI